MSSGFFKKALKSLKILENLDKSAINTASAILFLKKKNGALILYPKVAVWLMAP
jgi:hypothetical protein